MQLQAETEEQVALGRQGICLHNCEEAMRLYNVCFKLSFLSHLRNGSFYKAFFLVLF
ncbi:hypothetical protein ANCCAN_09730 [Ancylostoma caninum]|uniref:Uncharacterized protein n=1 Tax=Ancylostoma caninum TaxID=29170 RepID=A0A368GKU6_ANCCA|nr:hypothetical protein ANCCAN_09730 [Ancylostoma caninum]